MSRFVSFRLGVCASLAALLCLPPMLAPIGDGAAHAQAVGPNRSGLPIPRFVTLKSSRVNLRVGPGRTYPVEWMYLKAGVPVEVIQEFDNWRRVRDADGTEGWINQSLLSGKRSAIVAPWNRGKEMTAPLLREPREDAGRVAILEPGAMGQIERCNGTWCQMRFEGHRGWVSQALIWGAYPRETVDN